MKKVLLSLAAVTAIAAATPAAADHERYGRASQATSINARQAELMVRIDTAYRRHQISPYEANRLVAELRQIEAVERRYRRTGHRITPHERQALIARLNRVQAQLRVDRRDNDWRYEYGYGYGRW